MHVGPCQRALTDYNMRFTIILIRLNDVQPITCFDAHTSTGILLRVHMIFCIIATGLGSAVSTTLPDRSLSSDRDYEHNALAI
jgi:uncharacterized protein YdaL